MLQRYGRFVPSLRTLMRTFELANTETEEYARNKVYGHLALWCLNCCVRLTRRNGVPLRKELEVVDKCLHALFHGCTWRG
jgi:hypothetical protein